MNLTRANVTAASRIMLPAYAVFFAALGLNYLITPRHRLTESPGLEYADRMLPLPAWGVMFLACATLMAFALLLHSRTLYRGALWVCIVSLAVFAVALTLAAIFSVASPTAVVWPLFVMTACVATERSLLLGEA